MGIQLFEDLPSRLFHVHIKPLQELSSEAVTFPQQAQQDVFCADVDMMEGLGLFCGEGKNFLSARRIRYAAEDFLIDNAASLFFQVQPNRLKFKPQFAEHIDGDSLAQTNDPEQ